MIRESAGAVAIAHVLPAESRHVGAPLSGEKQERQPRLGCDLVLYGYDIRI